MSRFTVVPSPLEQRVGQTIADRLHDVAAASAQLKEQLNSTLADPELAAKRKEEKLAANKGKSTQELLAEMYADADEDGKASLAAAWEAGRSKREGNGPPPSE